MSTITTTPATRFRTTVELAGKTATGLTVPPDDVEALGAGRQPLVVVTVEGHSYRSKVAVRGGEFKIPLSAENRELARVGAGDVVDVELALDVQPREIDVPEDLARALEAAPEARAFFETLSYSQQKWYVLPIEQAKAAATRERRVAKALAMLAEGRKG
jgi:hypothetical protein